MNSAFIQNSYFEDELITLFVICHHFSETLSVNTFHYVQINLQTYFDSVLHQRKEAILWSRRY